MHRCPPNASRRARRAAPIRIGIGAQAALPALRSALQCSRDTQNSMSGWRVREHVHELAKRIAHEKSAHAPWLADRTVFNVDTRLPHAVACGIEVIDLYRDVRYRRVRSALRCDAHLHGHR